MKPALLVIAASAAMSPALAISAGPPAASTVTKPVDKRTEKVVCRTEEVVGTRLASRKVCMTVAQWREVSHESGQWLEHRTSTLQRPGGG